MYHLIGFVHLCLIIGLLIGISINFVDTAPDNDWIENVWDCHDGCVYAEWFIFGQGNLVSESELYTVCADACWYGWNEND